MEGIKRKIASWSLVCALVLISTSCTSKSPESGTSSAKASGSDSAASPEKAPKTTSQKIEQKPVTPASDPGKTSQDSTQKASKTISEPVSQTTTSEQGQKTDQKRSGADPGRLYKGKTLSQWREQFARLKAVSGRKAAVSAFGAFGPDGVSALEAAMGDEAWEVRHLATSVVWRLGARASSTVPTLTRLLKDPETQVLRSAAGALGSMGLAGEVAVPELVKLLKHPKEEVRRITADSLGRLGSKKGIPALTEALSDKSERVYLAAVLSLARVGAEPSTTVPMLTALLGNRNVGTRMKAAQAVRTMGDKAVPFLLESLRISKDEATSVPLLVKDLRHKNEARRFRNSTVLEVIGEGAVDALMEVILVEEDLEIVDVAVETLGRIGPKAQDAIPLLVDIFRVNDKDRTEKVIRAISGMGRDAVPLLLEGLGSPERLTRIGAVRTLQALGRDAEEAIPDLMDLVEGKESDLAVREWASQAVSELVNRGHEHLILEFLELMEDDSGVVRENAAFALGRIGEAAVPMLRAALTHEKREVQYRAAFTLGAIGRSASVSTPDLIELLKSDDVQLRRVACSTLGVFGPDAEAAVPELRKLLGDLDSQVQQAAQRALGLIQGR